MLNVFTMYVHQFLYKSIQVYTIAGDVNVTIMNSLGKVYVHIENYMQELYKI
jgi:hypothetical protein